MQHYLQSILSPHYQVLTSSNGEEAWDILQRKEQEIHLVLSDVMMPKLDGFGLVEKLKNDANLLSLPVILLTARSHPKDKIRGLTMGIDDYLLKPFMPQELLVRIQNLLQRIQRRPSNAHQSKKTPAKVTPYDLQWLQSVEKWVRKGINNSQISLGYLADQLNLSKRQVQRRLQRISGLTPSQYIREIKLQMAKDYLEAGKYQTTAEVAYAIGFNSVAHFSNIYLQRFGKRPNAFFE